MKALFIVTIIGLILAVLIFGGTAKDPNLRTWQAVADDDSTGSDSLTPCASYQVRYSLEPITEENWDQAQIYPQGLSPKAPGQPESLLIRDLPQGRYYIAIKSIDSAGNVSPLSNVINWKIDKTAPRAITDLK